MCVSGKGVRYILSAINIVIVGLKMCNLTLSSILQKTNKTRLQSSRIHFVMQSSGLNSSRAHLVFFLCMME